MAPQIGLKWPIDENTIASGVVTYVSGDRAKQLLAAGNGHEFRLEAGHIVIAEMGEYGPEAEQFARSLSESAPRPNRHRAICRIEDSDRDGYDVRITTYPGNRANLDEVIGVITRTIYPHQGVPTITYVR
jgi:hypothetical protein